MVRYAALSLAGWVMHAVADGSSIELGPFFTIAALIIGSSGIGAVILAGVQRRKLAEETSDLAMVKLKRAMDAQHEAHKAELAYLERRIGALQADLERAYIERDHARDVEAETARRLADAHRAYDDKAAELTVLQKKLAVVEAALREMNRRRADEDSRRRPASDNPD